MSKSLFSNTPEVSVLSNRGLSVRDIEYCWRPDTPLVTDVRITRLQYSAHGFLIQSADPRLHNLGRVNFVYSTDLAGNVLLSQGADNGTKLALSDAAGRPAIAVSNISLTDEGKLERSQAVIRTWQYEARSLPGRPLSLTEQVAGEVARITECFVYAGNSDAEKALNLVGQCVSHYDTAGLLQTDRIALTNVPLSVTRHLPEDADNPDVMPDWQGQNSSAWRDRLEGETCLSLTTADATGAMLTTTDAKGHLQRVAWNIAGQLSGRWLTLKGETEQVILKSLAYSAAGQKLREEHGNGVVTTYAYEPQTQRLVRIKTARPAGHASGAKVLQDLRYEYDPVGNVLKVRNDAEATRFWRNQKVVPESTYTYDSLYQLISATGREMANVGQQGSHLPSASVPLPTDSSAYTHYTRTYRYDNAGNLTQIRHSAPATQNSYTTEITLSTRSNRGVLSTLTENAAEVEALFTAGGQQMQLQPGQHLSWTPRSELLKVSPVVREGAIHDDERYRYDSGSQRILKVSRQQTGGTVQTKRVLYLPGLEQRTVRRGDTETENLQVITVGEAGQAQVRILHWEKGKPEGINNSQLRYSYDNLIGSSGLEVDGDGNIISMEEYYPYGGTAVWTVRSQAEASYRTLRYSGKERDATGLYYYGYRYYQPWVGRWLSADPAGTVDGLNLYSMVRNNPVTLQDEDGRMLKAPAMTFKKVMNDENFGALDNLLKFPDAFIKSEGNRVTTSGNINEQISDSGEREKKIEFIWTKQVIPRFEPTYDSEKVSSGAASSDSFNKDLHRSRYSISYVTDDNEIPFSATTVDTFLTPENKKTISTIAHQGHLADVSMELYGIARVNEMHTFSPKRNSEPEHKILVGENTYKIKSTSYFELKDMETEEYIDANKFYATVQQTTTLDATTFNQDGNRVLTYQSADKPSVQSITLHVSSPGTPVRKNPTLLSRIFKR